MGRNQQNSYLESIIEKQRLLSAISEVIALNNFF